MKDTILVGLSLLLFMQVGLFCQQAELLPRRAYFGVGLEKHEVGARVFSVGSGSTAAGVGMAVGDVILTVDDQTISTPEAVVAAISRYRPGQSVRMEILRDGERRAIQAVLKPLPFEEMKNATVEYSSVVASPGRTSSDDRLRALESLWWSIPCCPSDSRGRLWFDRRAFQFYGRAAWPRPCHRFAGLRDNAGGKVRRGRQSRPAV